MEIEFVCPILLLLILCFRASRDAEMLKRRKKIIRLDEYDYECEHVFVLSFQARSMNILWCLKCTQICILRDSVPFVRRRCSTNKWKENWLCSLAGSLKSQARGKFAKPRQGRKPLGKNEFVVGSVKLYEIILMLDHKRLLTWFKDTPHPRIV